jgi:glucosamine kinase
MSGVVLGVDGGGTKTLAAVADARGRVLGVGRSGASNHDDLDEGTVADNLQRAVDGAWRRAGGPAPIVDAVFLGLAGVVSQRDHARIRGILARTEFGRGGRVEVDHDIRIALAGGLAGEPGIAVIAGTGSACYGRAADGTAWRSGGWGQLLADEGSGYWLGLGALRAAVQQHDGRRAPTRLLPRVLELLGLASMDDVMHRVYVEGMTRSSIAALAPTVVRLAEEGEPACSALLTEGARELVRCVEAAAARLPATPGPLLVTYSGGLLGPGSALLARLTEELRRALPTATLVSPLLPPVLGACLLALTSLGIDRRLASAGLQASAAAGTLP